MRQGDMDKLKGRPLRASAVAIRNWQLPAGTVRSAEIRSPAGAWAGCLVPTYSVNTSWGRRG